MASAWGDSWASAWGFSWGGASPVIVVDTHDGGHAAKRRKQFREENEERREDIRQAIAQKEKHEVVTGMGPVDEDEALLLALFIL